MRIDEIKVNGFGKIKEKEIEFKDGINLVYGGNESGKSTILKFIEAMLYGVAKTKNGKNISDFDQYKPWDDTAFSGKMKYRLEDGKKYEVFRDFKKKNPVIYYANEDISKEFKMDKSKGIPFFEEQIGIDETSFCNTAIIGQQQVKLGKTDTNDMVQKISNLVSSGDDHISFKKSMEKLNKSQNERIGSERTKQKPINVVEGNIRGLLTEKNQLKSYQEKVNNQDIQKEYIASELLELQEKKEILKQQKNIFQEDEIKVMKAGFQLKICVFVAMFLVVLAVILGTIFKSFMIGILPIIGVVIDIFMIVKIKQKSNSQNLKLDFRKIEKEMENIDNNINDLKLKSRILETEKANVDEKLEELARVEETLAEQERIKEELLSLQVSYEIAKECLEKAYDEIKHNLSPQFERKLCEITTNLTNGKYTNVSVNDEKGLLIEVENGAYMPVERLSLGTIDEMYLALRLSILAEISNENVPILLDETFAYFDKERLKNMMCYLQDKNYNNQIIIFTCTNREEEVLKELKIEYHLINLEK